jgi:hypothetical protein
MTEDDLKGTVIDMCGRLRLLVAHFRPAQIRPGRWVTAVEGDGKGFPDCVIAGLGGVLYRELKQDRKYPEPEQRKWMAVLTEAGADVDVWRPRDLLSGRIEAELKALTKPREAP